MTTPQKPDAVTWAIALKAPNGRKCLYYEPATPKWQLNDHNIDEWVKRHVCSQTWKNHILYNDESPIDKVGGALAHAKGIVVLDDKTVGWLIHSTPKWPGTFLEENGQQTIALIPQGETEYGQSFVYLTMPITRLPDVIGQLQLSNVHTYGVEDNTNAWSRKKRAPAKKDSLKVIKLSDTITQWHVAKNKAWAQDLYTDYLAPTYGALIQETWGRRASLPTSEVLNAEELAWPVGDIKYNETNDHSKWAVSQNLSKPFAAIGDINFMSSQKHRGGGGIIIQDADLAKSFKALITRDREAAITNA